MITTAKDKMDAFYCNFNHTILCELVSEEAHYELAMEHSDFEDSKADDSDQTNWELEAAVEDLNEGEDCDDPFFVRAPFLLDPLDEFGDDVNNTV
ncbi:hypothetical protein GEMRC1_010699 [Eukaryota sp. GEM-RC1]